MLSKDNKKTFIICEMAQSYEGSFDIAKNLVDAAVDAGADAIKFQVFGADELATQEYKHYPLFKKLEFSKEQWGSLVKQAHSKGIMAIADVFGIESAKMLLDINIDGFKIHATDVKNLNLIRFVAKSKKPVLLSTSGSTKIEIQKAINTLRSDVVEREEIILMHGIQSYPTNLEDIDLNRIKLLQNTFNLPIGFADHIGGDHELKFDLCAIAIGMGARVIEKHITTERTEKREDYESALSAEDFKNFVKFIRDAEKAFGNNSFNFSEAENKYRSSSKKHIIAGRDLNAGEIVAEKDIVMKRTAEEYPIQEMEDIINSVVKIPIKKDSVIKSEYINEKDDKTKKKRVVCVLACRVQSKRLYAKPLQLLDIENNITILDYIINQLKKNSNVDQTVLAISEGKENSPFVQIAKNHNIEYIFGDENDVLSRLISAGEIAKADIVLRITSECPFIYWEGLPKLLHDHINGNYDLSVIEKLPEGAYFELINLDALKTSHKDGENRHRSELCTLYINENPQKFKILSIVPDDEKLHRPDVRITVDYPEDLIVARELYKELCDSENNIYIKDIIEYLDSHPALKQVNGWIDAGLGRIWS